MPIKGGGGIAVFSWIPINLPFPGRFACEGKEKEIIHPFTLRIASEGKTNSNPHLCMTFTNIEKQRNSTISQIYAAHSRSLLTHIHPRAKKLPTKTSK